MTIIQLYILSLFSLQAYETITQVDLVPTISLLLGAPIPFSNLGTVITDLFKTCTDCKRPLIEAHYNTARVLHLNAVQVHQYITAYAQLSGVLSADKLNEYDNLFQTWEAEYEALLSLIQANHDANVLIERLENLSNQYKQYLSDIRSMCHSVWAQFDIPRMLLGIGLCLTASILTFVFLWEGNFSSISMAAIGFSVFIFVSVGLVIFEFEISFILFVLGLLLLFFCILFVKFIKFDKRVRNSLSELDLFNVFSLFLWIFYISSMFSNSFLVYEGDVTGFFSESLFVMQFLKVFSDLSKSSRKDQKPVKRTKHESGTIISPTMIIAGFTLFACFAVRMSRFFHVCREEQSNCSSINLAQSIPAFSSSSTMYTNCCFLISAFCIAILPYTAYRWLRYTGNLNGYSPAMLVASYGVSFTAFLICIYWGMRGLSDKHTIPLRLATPRIIYALSLASIVALLFKPLCLYVVGKQPRDDSIPLNTISGNDLVPQIYNHLKMSWKKHLRSFQSTGSTTPAEKEPVVVYGLASVYSASSIVLLTTVSMVIALLLGEHLVPSVLFLWLAMFVILELHACRVHSMTNFGESFLTCFTVDVFLPPNFNIFFAAEFSTFAYYIKTVLC